MRKRILIIGQSFGTFAHPIHSKFVRMALEGIEYIGAREPQSLSLLQNELRQKKARLIWDTAFLVTPVTQRKKFPFENNPHCIITIRPWSFPGKPNSSVLYKKYIDSIIEAAITLNAEGISPVFVPQVRGPFSFEDDVSETRKIQEYLAGENAHFLYDDLSPSELSSIYSGAEFLIGTRFHSVILALSNATPAISISYSGFKATGIMEMLGLEQYVLDINDVANNSLKYHLRLILQNRSKIQEHLKNEIPKIRKELDVEFRLFKN